MSVSIELSQQRIRARQLAVAIWRARHVSLTGEAPEVADSASALAEVKSWEARLADLVKRGALAARHGSTHVEGDWKHLKPSEVAFDLDDLNKCRELTDEDGLQFKLVALNDVQRELISGLQERRLNGGGIDWSHWVGLEWWTAGEAARLLVELDPARHADLSASAISAETIDEPERGRATHLEQKALRAGKEKASPSDWLAWAKQQGFDVPFGLEQAVATANGGQSTTRRHEYKLPKQEKLILECIRRMGKDPQKLPKHAPGKEGVKAMCWQQLEKEKSMFQSRGVFNAAWERLRADGSLSDA